jgi:signal transduction histidine kinase
MADVIEATAALHAPLVHQGRELGALEAFDRLNDGPGFTADDEWAIAAFAESAEIAVATAQNVAAQTQSRSIEAADRERAHWARELHGEALQELRALKLTLQSADRCGDSAVLREAVREAIDHSEHAQRALREVISDLRPAALDALGAQAALESLVERIRARSSLGVELLVDLAYESGRALTRHTPALEAAIYRTVQEALTNVVEHADATRVSVTVRDGDADVLLAVEDDGRGFAAQARPESGFGLTGIGECVDLLDGVLSITSSAGSGTSVRASLPIRRRPIDAPTLLSRPG